MKVIIQPRLGVLYCQSCKTKSEFNTGNRNQKVHSVAKWHQDHCNVELGYRS